MKYALATVTFLFLVSGAPATAAPQWVYDYCRAEAFRVRPALHWGEMEAYVANCIADWTAGKGPQHRKSYKRDRY
jgi:hypothetical protein